MKNGKKGFAIILCSALCVFLAACGAGSSDQPDRAYPVKIGDAEIIVGQTQLSALYDIGCSVEVTVGGAEEGSEYWRTAMLSQDMVLAEKSIYTDFYIIKDGVKQAAVDVTIDEPSTLADATISDIRLNTSISPTEYITFDGVALADLTQMAFLNTVAESVAAEGEKAAAYIGENYTVKASWNDDGSLATLEMAKNHR